MAGAMGMTAAVVAPALNAAAATAAFVAALAICFATLPGLGRIAGPRTTPTLGAFLSACQS